MSKYAKVKMSENFTFISMKILKVSPKGQVTIPKNVRAKLKGDAFAMEVVGDAVVLKPIKLPKIDELSGFASLAEKSFAFWKNDEDDVYQDFYK